MFVASVLIIFADIIKILPIVLILMRWEICRIRLTIPPIMTIAHIHMKRIISERATIGICYIKLKGNFFPPSGKPRKRLMMQECMST